MDHRSVPPHVWFGLSGSEAWPIGAARGGSVAFEGGWSEVGRDGHASPSPGEA
jgi:hypothetical protein